MRTVFLSAAAAIVLSHNAHAQQLSATMHVIDQQGIGAPIGEIAITSTSEGATFTGTLTGLQSGEHGFHVHANGDCGPGPNDAGEIVAGGAAGKHWDPVATGMHRGPMGDGHLGDLPAFAGPDGTAHIAATAPRITDLDQLRGKALMIHAMGDNYADEPKSDGGGGTRVACGIIQ
jgi:Cu-Zn family superoxide dismutase